MTTEVDKMFGGDEDMFKPVENLKVVETVENVAKENTQKEKIVNATPEVSKVSKVENTGLEMPKPASSESGKYFKMTNSKHYIRLFTFVHEGKTTGCIPIVKHWTGEKFEECSGAGCDLCKKSLTNKEITKSVKYRVNVIDRKIKPLRVQIWEMPASAYKDIHKYYQLNGADKTFGNKGRTFLLEYFKEDHKYSMTPFEKDEFVLSIKSEEIYDLLDGDSRDMEEDSNKDKM